MKRKLYSLLITFIMITALIPCINAVFAEDAMHQTEIDTVCGLGLMTKTDGDFMNEAAVTRGELASIIASMYKTGNEETIAWKEKFFKELDEEFETADSFSSSVSIFTDVDETSEYYDDVKIVKDLGIMTGYTDGSFGAENSLTYEQAYKVMVTMLGYRAKAEVYGGFPSGYRRMANELKMLKGITQQADNITREDMAVLIYNTLDVNILDIVSIGENIKYTSDGTDTFLQRFLGMEKITGRMNDNGYSNLIGEQVSHRDFVTVEDVKIRVTDTTEYVRDFFGRTVNAYVANDNEEYTMVYAATDNLDTVVTINAEDFKAYTAGKIEYRENDKNKSVSFKSNAYMIYNGSGKATYDENTFKFNKGTISVVTAKGESSADLIVVNKYDSVYLDYVDYNGKKLYSKNNKGTEMSSRTFDLDRGEDFQLRIYNPTGELATLDELSGGMVISVAEGEYAMIIHQSTNKVAGFTVAERTYDKNGLTISNGTDTYIVSQDYIDLKGAESIVAGKVYTLMTDIFGDVVYVREEAGDDYNVALLVDSASSGDSIDELAQIKILTVDGKMDVLDLASSVTILDSSSVESKYKTTASVLSKLSGANHSLIRYKSDADKKVNYIELPCDQQPFGNPDNRLQKIYMSPDRDYVQSSSGNYGYYYKPNHGFGGQMLVDNTVKVFTIDPNLPVGDEDAYGISDRSLFGDDGKYEVEGYTTVANSVKAEFIIYQTAAVGEFLSVSNKTVAIFDSSYIGLNSDGEAADMIRCFVGATENNFVLSEDFTGVILPQWNVSSFDEANKKEITLEKGDIFRYLLNGKGEIVQIQLLVDENEINPASGGQGNLAGTIGYWDSANYTYSNPYSLSNSTPYYSFQSNAIHYSANGNAEMRNAFYRALSVTGTNQLKVTTQDLSVEEYDSTDTKYLTDNLFANSVTFVTINADGVSVKKGTAAEIKTYEIAGKDCDRVFVMTRVSSLNNLIVYTNYSEN